MRVGLINPPRIHPKGWGKPTVYQPLAVAYVAAVLEKKHKVKIIDAPTEGWKNFQSIDETNFRVGLTNKQIGEKVKQWSPDIIGVHIPFSGWSKAAFEVAKTIKEIDNSIPIILDGLHPSARPIESLSRPEVDYVIRGEGEYSTLELVNTIEQGNISELKNIEGIGFIQNGKPKITSPRLEIQDLDSLPLPARHLLPMKTYFEAIKENPIRGIIRKHYAIMLTSRGCPHKCVFCSNHIVWGKKWRGRKKRKYATESI